jgi:glycine/D-amino acid oxidase-like deaminating enzyme
MDIETYMEKETREFVKTRLPSIGAEKVSSHGRCIYQACALKDGKFLIGVHPEDSDVAVACGFTGKGFKFPPVIGEFLVNLVTEGGSDPKPLFNDMVAAFKLDRQ